MENLENQSPLEEQTSAPEETVVAEQPAAAQAPEPIREVEAAAHLPFATEYVTVSSPKPAQKPQKPRKKRKAWKALLAVLAAIALAVCASGFTAAYMNEQWQAELDAVTAELNRTMDQLRVQINGSQASALDQDGEASGEGLSPAQVYAMNVDAVVAISSQGQTTNIFGQTSETASGSGFIVSENGYVVTNYHVISGGSRVGVILSNGDEYNASIVGYDEINDIAVLKISGENFQYASLGSSDAMVVGDRVAAIGNPMGELSSTLTVGYISAKDRKVNTEGTYQNMIQTDAAINSGNSGGPLFNMRGEVIGITTAKYSGTSSSGATIEGIGFAIPIDDVRNLIDDLCEFGHVKSGYLGIMAQDVDAETAEQYGLPLGALVVEVNADSCAERGGIMAKDIIVDLNGQAISSMSDLSRALSNYEGGEDVTITVYRNGGKTVLNITLDEKPVTQTVQSAQQEQESESGFYIPDWFNPFG